MEDRGDVPLTDSIRDKSLLIDFKFLFYSLKELLEWERNLSDFKLNKGNWFEKLKELGHGDWARMQLWVCLAAFKCSKYCPVVTKVGLFCMIAQGTILSLYITGKSILSPY